MEIVNLELVVIVKFEDSGDLEDCVAIMCAITDTALYNLMMVQLETVETFESDFT